MAHGDYSSRMHRIINAAKFEVEEIQRRHRQNETDSDNLDKELDKMRVEGENIEKDVAKMREQTAQFADEGDRLMALIAAGSEGEKNCLDEKLEMKKLTLQKVADMSEERDRAHAAKMCEWRDKMVSYSQGWETIPHIRELREWERKWADDQLQIARLRDENRQLFERMDERKEEDERMKKFGSVENCWVDFSERWLRYREKESKNAKLAEKLRMAETRANQLNDEFEKEKNEMMRLKESNQVKKNQTARKSSSQSKASRKNNCKPRLREDRSDAAKRSNVRCPLPPSAPGGYEEFEPRSPPSSQERMTSGDDFMAPRSSTMMKTPQLNIPSFLRKGSGIPKDKRGNPNPVPQRFDAHPMNMETSSSSEEARPETDSFDLRNPENDFQVRDSSYEDSENLSFNVDFGQGGSNFSNFEDASTEIAFDF